MYGTFFDYFTFPDSGHSPEPGSSQTIGHGERKGFGTAKHIGSSIQTGSSLALLVASALTSCAGTGGTPCIFHQQGEKPGNNVLELMARKWGMIHNADVLTDDELRWWSN